MDELTRVGLVDDEPLFTAGLAMIIDAQPDLTTAWRANDGNVGLTQQQQDPAELLLVDIQMPGLDGLELTRKLIAADAAVKVMILTTFDTDANILGAIEAGASGFLVKSSEPTVLLSAIRTIAAGEAVISPGPTRRLLDRLRPELGATHPRSTPLTRPTTEALTRRELDLLQLVAQGLTNTEICDRLWLSMPTVKTHIGHLLAKTGSRDRVQLVLFALRTGVVSLEQTLLQH